MSEAFYADAIPPQDLDAEQAALGACLYGGDRLVRIAEVVAPEDFYRDAHATILRACLTVADAGGPVDLVTVASALKDAGQLDAIGGFDYLDRLQRVTPRSDNGLAYAERVAERAIARRIANACAQLRAQALAGTSAAELQAGVDAHLAPLARSRPRAAESIVTAGELLDSWQREGEASIAPISTGLPTLDAWMGGGWWQGDLHVLAAMPGRGKSALVVHFLDAADRAGRRAFLLSMEMQQPKIRARLLSLRSGLPVSLLLRGELVAGQTYHDWRGYRCEVTPLQVRAWQDADAQVRESGCLFVDYARGVHIRDAAAKLRYAREELGCELLVVDLFNNLRGDGLGRERYDRKDAIAETLRDLAGELRVPLLTVAQVNKRANEVKETQTLEEAAVWMAWLLRANGKSDAVLDLRKHRDLREGRLTLQGDVETLAWYEADPEETPQAVAGNGRHGYDPYLSDACPSDLADEEDADG